MNGGCYIDGVDIYSRFGAKISRRGYNELMTFPSLVTPDSTDWPEEDGLDVDLSEPVLDSKDVDIVFFAADPDGLINFVSQPGYHTFNFPSLKREWQLRIDSQSDNKVWLSASSFSLKFVDDFPRRAEEYTSGPGCGVNIPASQYEIDAVSFRDYGIVVSSGYDELRKSPTVKQNLTRQFKTSDGKLYDADLVVFNSKEVTFKCSMWASDIDRFWLCYDAFFNDLIKPDERSFYSDDIGEEFPCYYKKMSGTNIVSLFPEVVVEFDLTLVFTVFRVNETEYILATEAGEWIVLEDDGETVIDMGNGN